MVIYDQMDMPAAKTFGSAWVAVGLAAGAQAINQIDKSVIGLAAEPIMAELSLSTTQYGLVAGSLYLLFAVGGIAIGFFAAPRFRPRSILIALLMLWSVLQLPIALAASLAVIVACRILLGAAEGGGTPTTLNVCHEWFPDDRRALPGAMMIVGGAVGSMLAAPFLTYLIGHHGWRSAFLACSMMGLAVAAGLLAFRREPPYAAQLRVGRPPAGSPVMLRRLLLDGTVIGNATLGLCAFWVMGFMVAWLAPYVRDQAGFSQMASGWVLSAVYLGQGAIVMAVALLSQQLLIAGYSSRVTRGFVMVGCMLGSGACFVGMAVVVDPIGRLLLITLGTALPGATFSLSAAMVSEVAPPAERYRLVSIVMAVMTLSALVSPAIAGASIEIGATHGWRVALLQVAAVAFAGALCGIVLLHPERTIAALARAGANPGEPPPPR